MRLSDGIGPVFAILAMLSITNCPPVPSIGPGAADPAGAMVWRDLTSPAAPGPGDPIGTIQN